MGREVKRVALDFDWPIDEIWKGYINPWYDFNHPCGFCDGSGYSRQAKRFHDQWYGNAPFDPVKYGSQLLTADNVAIRETVTAKVDREIAESKAGRSLNLATNEWTGNVSFYLTWGGQFNFTRMQAIEHEINRMLAIYNSQWAHHLIQSDVDALIAHEWQPYHTPRVELTVAWMSEYSIRDMFGSGSIKYICLKARCARENIPADCPHCKGECSIWNPPESEKKADDWIKEGPPVGDGWQIWETVSEGSPISPVFATPEELAKHMEQAKPWGASDPMSAERWLKWITQDGWAPSLISDSSGVYDGVAAMTMPAEQHSPE